MKRIFKIVLMLSATAMFAAFSCSDDDDDPVVSGGDDDDDVEVTNPSTSTGVLTITSSTTLIQADGTDAAYLEVCLDGVQVTDGVTVYDGSTNARVTLGDDFAFTTTESGTYTFWAAYGANITEEVATVNAVSFDIPELPADPAAASTDFHKNLFFMQFTGTGCGYCPSMVNSIRALLADDDYASNMVWAALHGYNSDDPAYYNYASTGYSAATGGSSVASAFGVSGFPGSVYDMYLVGSYYNESAVKSYFTSTYNRDDVATAGVCASSEYGDGQLVVTVGVKAAEAGNYRLGAWLLEDGIYGVQTTYVTLDSDYDYNTHNHCVRAIEGRRATRDYSGISVGYLEAGAEGEYAFCINLDSDWVTDNLHIIAFATADGPNGYSVTNAVDFVAGESITYQYN